MRQCINPNCPSFAEGRVFNADDVICPRCGQPLADVADGTVVAAPAPAPNPWLGRGVELLLALVLLVGVIAIVVGLTGGFGRAPAVAPGTPGLVPPGTATALAATVRNVSNTPIPIFVAPTPPGSTGGTLPGAPTPGPAPTATAPGGDIQSVPPGSVVIPGVSAVRLCRRLATAEACEQVTAYGSRDDVNLAVEAGFGPGGARSARVEWYDANGRLLQASDPVTPGRVGTYWIGFTLKQNQAWAPGVYRAVIYLDNVMQHTKDIPIVP